MSVQDTMNQLIHHLGGFKSPLPEKHKPIFWLGAGCSVYDGVPLNDQLLRQAMASVAGTWGSPQFQFDSFCESLGGGTARAKYLESFFSKKIKPDSPYHGLVRILDAGYADTVFTFNIDDLLEQAFAAAGKIEGRDYRIVKVPELLPHVVADLIAGHGGPRICLVKLHGDHRFGFNYMTSREITAYDNTIQKLVHEYSQQAAIVCGYSFFHLNVLTSFSQSGKSIYYVNKSFPDAPMVLSLMSSRAKQPLFIDGHLGCFEKFVPELTTGLHI